jgi:hypothetical protein
MMTSQVSTEPQRGTSDNTGQQYGKGIQGKPIDLRNLHDLKTVIARYLNFRTLYY